MADDDADDFSLVKDIVDTSLENVQLNWIRDGIQLMDYLYRRGKFEAAQRPDLILLDINMPLKNGREVLMELKSNPYFRRIPILILSTSSDPMNILDCYLSGASSYLVKPSMYKSLHRAITVSVDYWTRTVTLPAG